MALAPGPSWQESHPAVLGGVMLATAQGPTGGAVQSGVEGGYELMGRGQRVTADGAEEQRRRVAVVATEQNAAAWGGERGDLGPV